MLDLTHWEDRLNAAQTDLKKVGSAADIPAALRDLKQAPAVYLVPDAERGGRNAFAVGVHQEVSVQVGVLIGIKHAGARTGKKNIDQLKTVRGQVDAALLGWQPADAEDQIEYVSGRRFRFTDQVLWWLDVYRTNYSKRSV